ncbi:MAG: sulfatase-like hydrolase/transferase [Planctomycetota bacterium]|nr:sulfatase-like hydrolase/transferase [Planctomycetota bacterium]
MILFLALIFFPSADSLAVFENTKTNVLILFADDLGSGDLGMHGGVSRTPNIDRLASEGVELTRYYGYPFCSPSRAALLTGQMPRRFGIAYALGAREPGLPAGLSTLPRTLQATGYQTWLVGKWHLGTASPPLQSGFNHFYGFEGPEIDYFAHTNRRGEVDWQRNGETVNEKGYSTFLIANEAIRLIDERDTKSPFYLQVAFNAPHFPLSAPESYLDKYKSLSKGNALRAAVVDAFDEAVGRILRAIETHGLSENTLVLFISDNGADQTGRNIPFRGGKGSVYEGGIRLPCFMRLPGKLPPGTRSHQACSAQDLYPTLASAVGVSLDENLKMDGKDRWGALLDVNAPKREPFVIAGSDMAIFDGDWKLIQSMDGRLFLFNLNEDPHEQNNVWAQNAEVGERLKKTLAEMTTDFPNLSQRRGPAPRSQRPGR